MTRKTVINDTSSLSSRVGVLEHSFDDLRIAFRDHANKTDKNLTHLSESLTGFMADLRSRIDTQPRPTPLREILYTIATTVGILAACATGMNWWLTQSVHPMQQQLERVYEDGKDAAVLRYRLRQLEEKAGIKSAD